MNPQRIPFVIPLASSGIPPGTPSRFPLGVNLWVPLIVSSGISPGFSSKITPGVASGTSPEILPGISSGNFSKVLSGISSELPDSWKISQGSSRSSF